jgi:hypothetical protein
MDPCRYGTDTSPRLYLVRISPEADRSIPRSGGQVGRDPRHGRRTEVERGYRPRVLG